MAPRRNGSVFQRKDGRWVAQVRVDGKYVTRYAKTRDDAEQLLQQLRHEPQPICPSQTTTKSPTIYEFADEWLVISGLKPTTEVSYRRILAKHVFPVLGSVRLDEIRPTDVAKLVGVVRSSGKSERTVQYAYTLVRRMLQVATDWGLIEINPAARVKRPRVEIQERLVWSLEETQRFLESCQHGHGPWDTLFVVGLMSGLRVGELLGLEWRDVNWSRGTITVRRALAEFDGPTFRIQTPKSKSSIRTVTLPSVALELLRKWQLHRQSAFDGIFRREDGTPPSRSTLRSSLIAACKRAGVQYIGMHGLRHQHVSLLAHSGVPVKAAQQRVGHSTPALTLGIYTHVLGDADAESAAALERALFKERPPTTQQTAAD